MKRLKKDYYTYKEYAGTTIKVLLSINFWIVINFRISNFLANKGLIVFARVFWLINRLFFSVDIDPRANIGGGFLLVHGMFIVIGKDVNIKGPVKIYHGTTLGGNNFKSRKYKGKKITQPVIEEGVTIGINSSILGPCLIEEDVIIGTGAIVTKERVEKGKTVIGANKEISSNC